jgi:hypothetical protein
MFLVIDVSGNCEKNNPVIKNVLFRFYIIIIMLDNYADVLVIKGGGHTALKWARFICEQLHLRSSTICSDGWGWGVAASVFLGFRGERWFGGVWIY